MSDDDPKDYKSITIDYTALRNAADRLKRMRDQWDKLDLSDYYEPYTLANPNGGGTQMGGGRPKDQDQIGHRRLAMQLGLFHSGWDGPVKHSKERVEQLAKTYEQVAHTWEDHDNENATAINAQTFKMKLSSWHADKEAYDNFQDLKEEHVTRTLWNEEGERYTEEVPLVDPDSDKGPPKPGPKPDGYVTSPGSGESHGNATYPDSDDNGDGNKIVSDLDADFDDEGNMEVHHDKSTVTDKNGESYSEDTTYKDGGGYTTKIEHSDGTTETKTVTYHGDGDATLKDVTDDETTTYQADDYDPEAHAPKSDEGWEKDDDDS